MKEVHMPKYVPDMVAGYYLYFTSHCIVEAMYVHASDSKLTESGSAKFSSWATEIRALKTGAF